MKVVINKCYGGFGLSEAAMREYYGRKGKQVFCVSKGLFASYFDEPVPAEFVLHDGSYFMPSEHPEYDRYNKWYSAHALSDRNISRDDKDLVDIVGKLGKGASGRYAELAIVEIPDDANWEISEHDGNEWVAEKHRTW